MSTGLPVAWAEPTGSIGTAQPIAVQANISGTLAPNDVDYYSFSGSAGQTYTIEVLDVSAGTGSTSLFAYDSAGTEIDHTYYCNATGNVCDRLEIDVPTSGTYYLSVNASSSTAGGSYTVRVLPGATHGLVHGPDGEPDDSINLAEPLSVGTAAAVTRTLYPRSSAYVTRTGDIDYYGFSATAGQNYTVEVLDVSTGTGATSLFVYDADGNEIDHTYYCNATGNTCDRLEIPIPTTGSYFFSVNAASSTASGSYTVRILPNYANGLVQGGDGEPDDSINTAEPIGIGTSAALNRTLYPRDDAFETRTGDIDYFHFSASAGQKYTVEVLNVSVGTQDTTLFVYDTAGNEIDHTYYCNATGNTCDRLEIPIPTTGTYYLSVNANSSTASGSYTVRVLPATGQGLIHGADGEPNDSIALAEPIGLGGAHALHRTLAPRSSAYVTRTGDIDYFGFPAVAGHTYTVETKDVSAGTGDLATFLYDAAGNTISNTYDCNASGATCDRLQFIAPSSGTYYFSVNASSSSASGSYTAQVLATPTTAGGFASLAPTRVLDTRTGIGSQDGAVGAGDSVAVQIAGVGGVPDSGVSAVVVNITVTGPTASGYITAYADGSAKPTASNLNFRTGQTVPNLAVVPVGTDGKIRLTNTSAGSVHLVADLAGYYIAGTPFVPGAFGSVAPFRALDTRAGNGAPRVPVVANGSVPVKVTGVGGVPSSGVSAVVVNITVTAPTASGYITAYADGAAKPTASTLNFVVGQTVPNLAVVPVGADGKIRLTNTSAGSVQLVADVAGYYLAGAPTDGGAFGSVAPYRALDTRTGNGAPRIPVAANGTVAVKVTGLGGVPAGGVSAVVVNITVTGPTASGYLTGYANGSNRPTASNLNFVSGQTVPNLAVIPVGPDGRIALTNTSAGSVNLVADIAGYYLPGN